MAELLVERVSKQFPTRAEPLDVLRDVSLQMSSGENLAILGPSGSGKSTLLNVIGGLDYPTSGSVQLDGQNPSELPEPELADFRNTKVGFVFQDHHLLPQLSVLENVLTPAVAQTTARGDVVTRARELIDRVGLAKRLDHRPAELSGGERQRVAVARALIRSPLLLLADEPTGNLDRANAISVGKLLLELQAIEETMLIVVTHSTELAQMLTRQLQLDDGRLNGSGRN